MKEKQITFTRYKPTGWIMAKQRCPNCHEYLPKYFRKCPNCKSIVHLDQKSRKKVSK